MSRLKLPNRDSDAWWSAFIRENIDIISPKKNSMGQDEAVIDFDLALKQYNAKFYYHRHRFPDGSIIETRAIDFETDSDMEMFILRWVK